MKDNERKAIVLVHGIWMKGLEFIYLNYKLRQQGYQVYHFRYPSLFKTPEQNAKNLNKFISKIDASTVHFVAHSMGGIILQHLFYHHDIKQKGKIVLIATPVKGSAVASYLTKKKYRKYLLGKAIKQGLLGDAPAWQNQREICMVAGTMSLGLGLFLAPKALRKPNDGTVNLDETIFKQATEHHEVARSHFYLLFSKEVVNIILSFLKK